MCYHKKPIEATIWIILIITLAIRTLGDDIEDFLHVHNSMRSTVGVGPMTWDPTLEHYAQDYANIRATYGCKMEKSDGPYGENLAEGYKGMSAVEAVELWSTEKPYYDYASNKCADGSMCSDYTQIVWHDSVRLGCARNLCSNGWVFVICSYDPPGNIPGQRPY